MPNTVYHYCSLDSFYNIIKNSNIRLSDIDMSNDYSERKLFKKITSQMINEKKKAAQIFTSSLKKDGHSFVFCLSSGKDLLSQWRGYANDGTGISIGFDFKTLNKINEHNVPIFKFLDVIYDKKIQLDLLSSSVDKAISILERSKVENPDNIPNKVSDTFYSWWGEIENCNLRFKGSMFSEEKEWRICLSCPDYTYYESMINRYNIYYRKYDTSPVLPAYPRISKENRNLTVSNILTTCLNNKIVSYVDCFFSDIKDVLIREIVLGPKCNMNPDEIKNFLHLSGYKLEKIKISKSKVTYR